MRQVKFCFTPGVIAIAAVESALAKTQQEYKALLYDLGYSESDKL